MSDSPETPDDSNPSNCVEMVADIDLDALTRADATREDGESWTEWVERATAALEEESTDDTSDSDPLIKLYEGFQESFFENAVAFHTVDNPDQSTE